MTASTVTVPSRRFPILPRGRLVMNVALGFLALMLLIMIFGPWLSPYDPNADNQLYNSPPSSEHWLGTDTVGRDRFSRLIAATRVSLLVGITVMVLTVVIGGMLGLMAGYFGGVIDGIIGRIADVLLVFPLLIVLLILSAIIGGDLWTIVLILGLMGWPEVMRVVRGVVVSVRQEEYVQAAYLAGYSIPSIIGRELLPNALPALLVAATFRLSNAIETESALSFLGMGIRPPQSSWGNMLSGADSLAVLTTQWWVWVPPAVLIALTLLSVNILGDEMQRRLNPDTQDS